MKKIHLDESGNIVQTNLLVDVAKIKGKELNKQKREVDAKRVSLLADGVPENELPLMPTESDIDGAAAGEKNH